MQYNECDSYKSVINSGKLVVGVEYYNVGGNVCSAAKKSGILTKYKNGSKWVDCF